MTVAESLGALGERQFRLLYAGQTLSNLGGALVPIALAFAVLLAAGAAQRWQLLVLQAAHGVAAAFFDPAATGLVPQTVSPRQLQQANALLGLSHSASGILGRVGAGVLVVTVGPALALAADAASFAASACA